MISTLLCLARLRVVVALFTAVVAGLLAPDQVLAYGAYGYYTGAEANPGFGGCTGADTQGYGSGCTLDLPQNDGLVLSTAYVTAFGNNYGSATASLAAASLDALASYTAGPRNNDPRSTANMTETFTLVGPIVGTATVTAQLLLDFSASGPPAAEGYQIASNMYVFPSGSLESSTYYSRVANCSSDLVAQDLCSIGLGTGQHLLSLTFNVSGAHPTFRLDTNLRVDSGQNELTHGHASLSFILPDGVALSSASGVFASAVPEPSLLALWSSGLALIGGFCARRARRRPR